MLKLIFIVSVVTLCVAEDISDIEIARPLPPILPTLTLPPSGPILPTTGTFPPCDPPIKCGENEVYLPLPIAPVCDTVCKRIGTECKERLYARPRAGCFCLPDHARNEDNICVPIVKCGVKCVYAG